MGMLESYCILKICRCKLNAQPGAGTPKSSFSSSEITACLEIKRTQIASDARNDRLSTCPLMARNKDSTPRGPTLYIPRRIPLIFAFV